MTVIVDFNGIRFELTGGFAWLFIGGMASVMLWAAVVVVKLMYAFGVLKG